MENTMKMYITADEVAELLGVSRGYESKIHPSHKLCLCSVYFALPGAVPPTGG